MNTVCATPLNHCGSEPARDGPKNAAITEANRVLVYTQRLKISDVLTPPNAKLLFITYRLLICRNSPRR